jgi:glucokinase
LVAVGQVKKVSEPRVLGIDLGGTKIAVSAFTPAGQRLDRRQFETLRGPPEGNLARIVELGRELLAGTAPLAIGVSGGGPLDPERGVIISIPNLPGWEEVPIADRLRAAFGAPVGIENDANACAIAEHRLGAGRGTKDMVFLTLSTGIGGGLILDGKIYRGHRFLAGEAGHQVLVPDGPPCGCGKRGCLEALASGTAIARRLLERREELSRGGGPPPQVPAEPRELVARARAGDRFSREFLRETAGFLAHGIANLVFILDPERVILGTIAVAAGDLLLAPLREEVDRRLWPAFRKDLKILPAGLGVDLGDYAAFAVAPTEGSRLEA